MSHGAPGPHAVRVPLPPPSVPQLQAPLALQTVPELSCPISGAEAGSRSWWREGEPRDPSFCIQSKGEAAAAWGEPRGQHLDNPDINVPDA